MSHHLDAMSGHGPTTMHSLVKELRFLRRGANTCQRPVPASASPWTIDRFHLPYAPFCLDAIVGVL